MTLINFYKLAASYSQLPLIRKKAQLTPCDSAAEHICEYQKGAVKIMLMHYFTAPFTLVAGRWPRVAHGRKIAKAFCFKLIKIKPEIQVNC
jgi:hypothetical protein